MAAAGIPREQRLAEGVDGAVAQEQTPGADEVANQLMGQKRVGFPAAQTQHFLHQDRLLRVEEAIEEELLKEFPVGCPVPLWHAVFS